MLYRFKEGDVLTNVIKAYPDCNFYIFGSNSYYNSMPEFSGAFTSRVREVPPGNISLYELNVDRP